MRTTGGGDGAAKAAVGCKVIGIGTGIYGYWSTDGEKRPPGCSRLRFVSNGSLKMVPAREKVYLRERWSDQLRKVQWIEKICAVVIVYA